MFLRKNNDYFINLEYICLSLVQSHTTIPRYGVTPKHVSLVNTIKIVNFSSHPKKYGTRSLQPLKYTKDDPVQSHATNNLLFT